MKQLFSLAVMAAGLASLISVSASDKIPEIPKGLPIISWPSDNPPSDAKIALGMQLYFDPRLSKDNTVSCASCHDPLKGFSNGTPFAKGVGGEIGGRSAPTVINSAYSKDQFWDGRAKSLEEQALGPIQNPIEMALSLDEAVSKLRKIEGYRTQFKSVFGSDVNSENIGKAIAAYERTVLSGNAPFDKFKAGHSASLSASAQSGMSLFFGKARCSACHSGASFSDSGYHNLGVGMQAKKPDIGREAVSKLEGDRGAFKTPTLREIARTAPYMHDGSFKTLEDVVDFYNQGGLKNEWLDEEIFPLKLSAQEKADLVVFLKEGLSSSEYPNHKAPKLP